MFHEGAFLSDGWAPGCPASHSSARSVKLFQRRSKRVEWFDQMKLGVFMKTTSGTKRPASR